MPAAITSEKSSLLARYAARPAGPMLAALGLGLFGVELRGIQFHGGDLPAGIAWLEWLARFASPDGALLRDAAPIPTAFEIFVTILNGQWDPSLVLLTFAVVHVAAVLTLVSLVVERASPWVASFVAVAATALFALSASNGEIWTALHATAFPLLLGGVHLGWSEDGRPRRRWLGRAAGLAGIFSGPVGILAVAAGLVGALQRHRPHAESRRPQWAGLAWPAALLLFGAWQLARSPAFELNPIFRADGPDWLALLPAMLFAGREIFARGRDPSSSRCFAFAAWDFLLNFAARASLDAASLRAITLSVSLACLCALPVRESLRPKKFLLGAAWLVAVVIALVHADEFRSAPLPATSDLPRAAAVRAWLLHRDRAALSTAFASEGDRAAELLDRPAVQARLPASARAPLPSIENSTDLSGAFYRGGAPALTNLPTGFDLCGNVARGGARKGEFAGGWVASAFPVLHVYVAGELSPPQSALFLRTRDGREFAPLQTHLSSRDRWRRVNFPNPGEPFQLVARSPGGATWLAFTGLVESGRGGWFAGKLLAGWSAWQWAGIFALGALAGAAVLRRKTAPTPLAPLPLSPDVVRWLPWLALFAYATLLAYHLDVYAGGSDSSGYLNSARLLLEGEFFTPIPRPDVPGLEQLGAGTFIPGGFVAAGATTMAPSYPVGLPLLYFFAAHLLPFILAVAAVNLAHVLFGVLLMRALAKCFGLTDGWAWTAAGWLALCPLFLFQGLQPMSDVAALGWVTAAVVGAWRSRTAPTHGARWAGLAGVATALAIMVRPSNVLALVPIVLALGWSPRRTAWWMLGGLPGGLFLLWYNFRVYGNPFVTGYGDPSGLFSSGWIAPTLAHYGRWLPGLLSPLVALIVLGPWARTTESRGRVVLVAWAAVYLAFYAAYFCTHESWWYLRFVLPAFPPLVLLALSAGRWVTEKFPARRSAFIRGAMGAALAAWLVAMGAQLFVLDSGRGNRVFADAAGWLEFHAPPGTIVLSGQHSGALLFYTHLPFVQPANAREVALIADGVARARRPLYAVLYPYELSNLPLFPGRWEPRAKLDDVTLWQWHPPATP